MPEIRNQYSLRHLNTFRLDVKADQFVECRTVGDVRSIIRKPVFRKTRHLVIGEGSNVLFVDDFNGLVLHPAIMGMEILREDRETILVQVGAGEIWDDFVGWATAWGFGGIENLSLIPGTVGSSPIQNIGAYGAEACQTIEQVIATDSLTGQKLVFENTSCQFGYRDSIFKRGWKDKCIITSVIFRLLKIPKLNVSYHQVAEKLSKKDRQDVVTMREIIIEIRRSKLPDPDVLGNAGSFFRNPVIPNGKCDELRSQYPDIPFFAESAGNKKVPAAWLIENCGWKGKRLGQAGTYEKQPLVLVNLGNANGKEILDLAESISRDVEDRFGILLDREVNIIL